MLRPLSPVQADRLDAVRALADAVFVQPDGRTPGVARRFPGLLEPGAPGEAVAVEQDGRIAGALALRPLAFPGLEHERTAAIGLVAVEPDRRSRGVGAELLRIARRRLEELGVTSAVLWASRHELYERAGWRLLDHGVRGEAEGAPGEGRPAGIVVAPLDRLDPRPLAALRALHDPDALERPAAWWGAIPFPGAQVHAVLAGHASAPAGYALFGERGQERFLMELVGEPATFGPLWSAVRAGSQRVTVNDRRGAPSQSWLERGGVSFTDQRLALWLSLGGAAGGPSPVGRHVPWFDRI
ncbi:MAG: GNAT family N-acetyltransferase [Solirubrobacteraceae bacterium]